MKSDIDRKLFMEERRRQRTRTAFFSSRRQHHLERRSPSWQFVIFDMLITKFIFTQNKHVHAYSEDGRERETYNKKKENERTMVKIMAYEERNIVEGQNKQLSEHISNPTDKCEKKTSTRYGCLSH